MTKRPALSGPWILLAAAACGSSLPKPRYVQQKTEALLPAAFPAPPARVEFVPPRPRSGAVWIDGEWDWSGSKWAWQPGRWVVPPPGLSFAPWTTVRDGQGDVYFARGVWVDSSGKVAPPPEALVLGGYSRGDVTSQVGDTEKTAPAANENGRP